MDNNLKSDRLKQQIYWNSFAFDKLYSLVDLVDHHQKPSQYTQKDYDWRDFYFTNKLHRNGIPQPQTFIVRSGQYLSNTRNIFDPISFYQTQDFQLNILKYQFWNRVRTLKSTSSENHQSKEIVKKSIMKYRFSFYTYGCIVATFINAISGIKKLSIPKQMMTFFALLLGSEGLLRYKMSSQIFYQIPKLPSAELERERKQIMNQCLVFDGTINNYDETSELENYFEEKIMMKYGGVEKKIEILQALGYKIKRSVDDVF